MSALPVRTSRTPALTPEPTPLVPGYVASEQVLKELKARRWMRRLFRQLVDGEWKKALIGGGLTQHHWREMTKTGADSFAKIETMVQNVTLLRTAMVLRADIITANGVTHLVREGYDEQAEALSGMRGASFFDARYHEACVQTNIEAECPIRIDVHPDLGAVLCVDSNDQTFPVGPDGPDGQPTVWERRWLIEKAAVGRSKPDRYLRVERHWAPGGVGRVDQEVYKTDDTEILADLSTLDRVSLRSVLGDAAPLDSIETGASGPLIVQLVNYRMRGRPVGVLSTGDVSMIDAFAAQLTQIARTMDLHGDPLVRVPEEALDRNGVTDILRGGAFVDPQQLLQYVVAEFKFDAMAQFLRMLMHIMLIQCDMAPALIGWKPDGGAAPDSYDKLRLEATATLASANRSKLYHVNALERLLTVASQVDAHLPGRGYAVAPVDVKITPELPKDQLQLAREQAEMLASGLTSERRAIATIHGEDQVDAVMEEIEADRKNKAALAQASVFGTMAGGDA